MDPLVEAATAWGQLDLSASMRDWDERYGHIVSNKESNLADRQRLVAYVKDFAQRYKAEPTSDKVDALLKFFRQFVATMFERIGVAENSFVAVYQKVAELQDPAPLLSDAHSERARSAQLVSEQQSTIDRLQRELSQLQHDFDRQDSAKISAQSGQVSQLRDEVNALKTQLDRAQTTEREQRSEIVRLRTTNASLEASRQQTESRLEEQQHVVDSEEGLRFEVETLTEQVALLTSTQGLLERQTAAAKGELVRVEAELAMQKESHQHAVRALNDQIDDLTRQLNDSSSSGLSSKKPKREGFAPSSSSGFDDSQHQSVINLTTEAQNLRHQLVEAEKRNAELNHSLCEKTDALLRMREENGELKLAVKKKQRSGVGATENATTAGRGYLDMIRDVDEDDDDEDENEIGASFSVGPTTAPAAAPSGFLTNDDFASILQSAPSSGTQVNTTTTKEDNEGGDVENSEALLLQQQQEGEEGGKAPSSSSMIGALTAQRNTLKRKLTESESRVSMLRAEVAQSRSRGHSLYAELQSLRTRLVNSDNANSASSGTVTINVGASGDNNGGSPTQRLSKQQAAVSKTLGAIDGGAMLLSRLLVSHRMVRLVSFFYLVTLHLVVFVMLNSFSSKCVTAPGAVRKHSLLV